MFKVLKCGMWDKKKKVEFTLHAEDKLKRLVKMGITKERVLVNYDEKGKTVEVEILNASKLLDGFLTEILKAPERRIVEIV